MFDEFLSLFSSPPFTMAIGVLVRFFPLWLPIFLFSLFAQVYLRYIRTKWIIKEGSVLLELKLPKEITKSPVAMELFLGYLYEPFVGTYLDVYLKGRVRTWFSLEIVSLEGQVKFFIWCQKSQKNKIEAQIYAQFPTVEIYEVPDYALQFSSDPSVYSLFASQFRLTKADVYPIKTYIDYGMDKDPKEEFKIDPMTPVLEFLGSLKQGEYAMYQILIQAHRKMDLKDAVLFKRPDWKSGAKKAIEEIFKESPILMEDGKSPKFSDLTESQKETINAIQRNQVKPAFETMIRAMYIAKKDSFNATNIGGLLGSFRQYSSGNLNGLAPAHKTGLEYPWQDFRGKRVSAFKREMVDAYKRRSFFNLPYKNYHGKPFILTTEELATIFHFPSSVAATPTLTRIPSKKAEPPSNLPL